MNAIGRKRVPHNRLIHVLLCQHEKEEALRAAVSVCEAAGLKRLPDNIPIAVWLLEEGFKRGHMRLSQPYSAWRLDNAGHSTTYENEMSTEVDRVLRSLRREHPGIRTMSASLDPSNSTHRALLDSIDKLVDGSGRPGGHADIEFEAERKLAKGDLEAARAVQYTPPGRRGRVSRSLPLRRVRSAMQCMEYLKQE